MKLKNRILPYYQAIPKLLSFQVVSFIVLSVLTWGISALCGLLLGLSGKAAVTSGDLMFLFTHWQGYVMIALTLLMVVCYIAVELNAQVIYCARLIDGEKPSIWQSIKEGFAAMKKYLNLRGVLIILYSVLIAPILGLGFSVSLTQSFYIPRFIMSVIQATPLFLTAYIIAIVALTIIMFIYIFIVHGALLDGMTMKEASVNSRHLMKKNWKNFIVEAICFTVLTLFVAALVVIVCSVLPLLIVQLIPMSESVSIFLNVLFCSFLVVSVAVMALLSVSFLIIKLTTLYKKYTAEDGWEYQPHEKKRHPLVITAAVLAYVLLPTMPEAVVAALTSA